MTTEFEIKAAGAIIVLAVVITGFLLLGFWLWEHRR